MTQIKDTPPAKAKRRSKQDWLDAALELLQTGGIEAVRVERLADMLGIAKSGFYYHFRDRADLRSSLLRHWVDLDHAPMNALKTKPDAAPADRLLLIAEIVDQKHLSRYDFAIRQWAQNDQSVKRVWQKEMNKRTDVIRKTFSELGFEGDDLEMRTGLFLAYHVTERDLFSELNAKERARQRGLRIKLLTTP